MTADRSLPAPADILAFWRSAGKEKWFGGGPDFDFEVKDALGAAHEAAAAGGLDGWGESAEGALALLVLLDQAPRNLFRGTPRAFATDGKALALAEGSIARGFDKDPRFGLPDNLRTFFYLPLMHAEDAGCQARCVALYEALGDANSLAFARTHKDIIDRFGRFPHRNPILGRTMTAEEQAYLDGGGFVG